MTPAGVREIVRRVADSGVTTYIVDTNMSLMYYDSAWEQSAGCLPPEGLEAEPCSF